MSDHAATSEEGNLMTARLINTQREKLPGRFVEIHVGLKIDDLDYFTPSRN